MHKELATRLSAMPAVAIGIGLSGPGQALHAAPSAPVLNSANILDTVGGLILVLALLLGLAWLVKRYMGVPGISKGRIQVVGGVSLGPRERAVIVEVDGERLLLGVAQGNVRMLHQLQPPGCVAESQVQDENFRETLQEARREVAPEQQEAGR